MNVVKKTGFRLSIAATVAAALMAGSAIAQTPSAAPAAPAPAAKAATAKAPAIRTAKAPVVRTAKSLDCSKQADSQGLHGKPRKNFMSKCKKA